MWFSFFITWEQRKFESLAETRRGLTYNPSNISPHGIRVLRSSNINEDTFVLSDDDVFVCPDAVKIECAKPNDILITAANGSTRLVGKHAIIVGIRENEAVHGGFMLVASSSMPFFLNAAMSAPWYLKFINLFVAGGNGAIGNLNKNDLDNQLLFVPKNAEQEQIGEFFRNFDNLITLHQCKRAAFVSRKSPSIFQFEKWRNTLTWEQRKFGEYFEERNERSGEGELISVTINSGIKKFNELGRFDTKPEDLSKYKRVEVGDIAYNSMRMWQGASGYSPYSGILSPAYTVISPRTGVSSMFFAYSIKRPQMIHLFEINSQGLTSDTWNLKFPAFSQIEASAPTEIAEQKNIAEIFTVLDNLITLHQRGENIYNRRQTW